jgi:cytochrome c oxidase subunit 3
MMLFIALSSAYVLRQATGLTGERGDWVQLAVPRVLWFTTAIIVLSSISMEVARRALKRGDFGRFNRWIVSTAVLGAVFLAGQLMAWKELAAQGIYISSNPHSSFFYLLTSLHAAHLLGGVLALSYVSVAAMRLRVGMKKRPVVEATALYWHFMDGLWLYLFLLLFFWK